MYDVPVVEDDDDDEPGERSSKYIKRVSSPERWEIQQLIASGALSAKDYPHINDDNGALDYQDAEEDVDIELNEEEPMFLKGQTKSAIELSPIKIVKNPDGTMNRAALAGQSLAKERKEMKNQKQNEEFEEKSKDTNKTWQDPMQEQKHRGPEMKPQDVPEWKKSVFSKATTFGKITSLSIKDQKASLPVFKLRSTFIKAVEDNQLLVVIGDTGSGNEYYSFIYRKERLHK